MARDRRPRDDDEDDDDRPRRKRRPAEDDEDEEEEERPRRNARARDDDEEEERPRRRKKKKPAGMNKGLLFGLIGGGVALVGVVVLLIVLLGGGGSPKGVMARVIRASKAEDFGTVYDNMAARGQQVMSREQFIEFGKMSVKTAGAERKANMTILGETVTGNTATVRVREASGWEDDIPFVKENGKWKLGK